MKSPIPTVLTAKGCPLLGAVVLGLAVSSCSLLSASVAVEPAPLSSQSDRAIAKTAPTLIWCDRFEAKKWMEPWSVRKTGEWGLQNTEIMEDYSGRFPKVLRVRYPADSASPTVSRKQQVSLGGVQFFADLDMPPQDAVRLSYYVRFSKDFDFVKGGKLPGLFGGTVTDGREIPDGTNGFSTRYMWRKNGRGEVYSYLPSSREHGSSLGRGNWRFKRATWHHLEQEVVLNQPGQRNGRIRVWFDGDKVLDKGGLTFRTTEGLKIEGILFSTFFGGGDSSWATPKDVYADFADFSVFAVKRHRERHSS